MRAGQPVGRGRSLVEHVHRGVVAAFEALLEDAVLFPEREDARVESGKVDARGHLAEPGSLVAHVTRFRRAAGPKAGRPEGRRADSTRQGRARCAAGPEPRRVTSDSNRQQVTGYTPGEMTSTLTPEQIEVYAATLRARTAETTRRRDERREQAWTVAREAAQVLRTAVRRHRCLGLRLAGGGRPFL